ncbi:hypothetical protein [Pseudanabaena yagii]|uniref:Uncharacterized protein n=1 Tax=Pseudanabaena yagii GIHE-NHR1 TaxID=2722753 RepID=A0ABX1M1R5_9CYAN|nr:hypothetical protein [Pseudanabaena yagii]NMF60974.1 hypothetical protein [Pseudanabaena yagii GIHE-NHR1]
MTKLSDESDANHLQGLLLTKKFLGSVALPHFPKILEAFGLLRDLLLTKVPVASTSLSQR